MNVLVTGAQFKNKGAQSLLFTVMSELRRRYENVEIYYMPIDDPFTYSAGEYKFHLVYDDHIFSAYRKAGKQVARWFVRCAKRRVKWLLKHKENNLLPLSRVWKKIDIVVNVSGYSLTSQFESSGAYRYVKNIERAKKRGIPVILMPQSFGPFDYKPSLVKKIAEVLNTVDRVYAREQDGADRLRAIGVEANVSVLPDTVLQSEEVDKAHVFVKPPEENYPHLTTAHNVGIVPNMQLYRYGVKEDILKMYRTIVERLLAAGKEVYIFRHSNDMPACEDIYAMFEGHERVHLLRDELSCIDYSLFVRQFEFIVASRFHSIVHAYRECVPALVLGWAVKYKELAAAAGQEAYVVDGIRITEDAMVRLETQLDNMIEQYEQETKVIAAAMAEVRKNNCYDLCQDLFASVL